MQQAGLRIDFFELWWSVVGCMDFFYTNAQLFSEATTPKDA